MLITICWATTKDRVLQYGTVACTLLKAIGNASNQPYLQAIASVSLLIMKTVQDIGNASNQPYLQAIASVSLLIMKTVQRIMKDNKDDDGARLLIMETVQRVMKDNKDACVQMTERAYELVYAIVNNCRDAEVPFNLFS
ncbi:hypothetical protein C8R44DRAFT_931502 [Mycena epipterygia]|nr:hypothetical protein C8R44DRAFT_931502 [Mycena epipterygia]